jgi:putative acetyltransferase
VREIRIRAWQPADRDAIREINRQAFRMEKPGTFEKLLATLDDARALVAEDEAGRRLGHVIFTPALIDLPGREVRGMGLGELAVLPEVQRRGIGTRLGAAGIAMVRAGGTAFSIVVGHARYYPRFGYRRGSALGLRCQWDKVPEETFMAIVFDEAAMRGVTGVARFRDVA